jgi:hypothetical protein
VAVVRSARWWPWDLPSGGHQRRSAFLLPGPLGRAQDAGRRGASRTVCENQTGTTGMASAAPPAPSAPGPLPPAPAGAPGDPWDPPAGGCTGGWGLGLVEAVTGEAGAAVGVTPSLPGGTI